MTRFCNTSLHIAFEFCGGEQNYYAYAKCCKQHGTKSMFMHLLRFPFGRSAIRMGNSVNNIVVELMRILPGYLGLRRCPLLSTFADDALLLLLRRISLAQLPPC